MGVFWQKNLSYVLLQENPPKHAKAKKVSGIMPRKSP